MFRWIRVLNGKMRIRNFSSPEISEESNLFDSDSDDDEFSQAYLESETYKELILIQDNSNFQLDNTTIKRDILFHNLFSVSSLHFRQ